MKYLKCICTSCNQPIEYPPELVNETINCPGCQTSLLLPEQQLPREKTGFFQGMVQKYKDVRQHSANLKDFKRELLQAVNDGVLTDDELHKILQDKAAYGLSDDEMGKFGPEVFRAAYNAARVTGHISPAAEANLMRIQTCLNISETQVPEVKYEMILSRRIYDIQNGHLPSIPVSNVILATGEVAHCREPGSLYEERVVSRHYEGGSSGVSFRVMKGVNFRVGAHRGNIVTEKADQAVSSGSLIITSERVIFQGDAKSFATKLSKIIDITPYHDGLRFSETSRQKPRLISFDNNNGEYVMEVLAAAIRNAL
jgi:hypothetical protein